MAKEDLFEENKQAKTLRSSRPVQLHWMPL